MKRAIFCVAVLMVLTCSFAFGASWQLYDDFNSSVIDTSKWIVEFEGGCVAPVIVNNSVSFACQNNTGWSESELEITDANIIGIQADLAFSSFSGTGWAEVSVVLGNDDGYESRIRIFTDGSTPQIEISYEYDHTPIFWEIKEVSSFGEVETLGISYEDENLNFFINGSNVKSYGVAAFNINFAEIGMVGTDSYFAGTADNVMVVIPEANSAADINGDGTVDYKDFAIMAKYWLESCDPSNNYCEAADLYISNFIDTDDLSILSENWLESNHPYITWVSINDSGVDGHEGFVGQMSKYETTNAQYCQYLNDAKASGYVTVSYNYVVGASGPYSGKNYYKLSGEGYTYNGATNGGAARINWTGSSFTVDSGFENHPVTYVSWYGSTAFASYYGWRLPTEWEWQAVADYNGSYIYGCGTTINYSMANYYGSNHPNGTTTVDAFGTHGYGMADMAGNVDEWTSSLYNTQDSLRVLRGGGWNLLDYYCEVSYQLHYSPSSVYHYLGFRVCR